MKRYTRPDAALLFVLAMSLAMPVFAAEDMGVVLMHGKGSTAKSKSPIGKLAAFLEGDFKVRTPDMPWSRSNGFNKNLQQIFAEIDGIVAELKTDGATKIVVGGHSMGAAIAIAYATRKPGLAGVLMIGPGHRPDTLGKKNTAALRRAKALIAAGKPDAQIDVSDKNQGKPISRSLRADIALSLFDPHGLAVMQNAAPKVRPGTPVLFIIGEKDRLHPRGRNLIFRKLPPHPKSAYTVVPGGHKATPMKGKSEIASWLRGL